MNPEERLHRAVADYLRVVLDPSVVWSTFPSGGGGRVRGAKLKAMGLRAGMPDIMIWWLAPSGAALCLGIELKAGKNGMTAAQRETFLSLEGVGCPVHVARSIDDVRDVLRAWGVPTREVV